MVPILLFGLVGIVGVAAIFRVLGDETDYAGDDLEDDVEAPSSSTAEEGEDEATTTEDGPDDSKGDPKAE